MPPKRRKCVSVKKIASEAEIVEKPAVVELVAEIKSELPASGQEAVEKRLQVALATNNTDDILAVLRTEDSAIIRQCVKSLPESSLTTLAVELNRMCRVTPIDMKYTILWYRAITDDRRNAIHSQGLRECLEIALGLMQRNADEQRNIYRIAGQYDSLVSRMQRNNTPNSQQNGCTIITKDASDDDNFISADEGNPAEYNADDKWSDDDEIASDGTRSEPDEEETMDVGI